MKKHKSKIFFIIRFCIAFGIIYYLIANSDNLFKSLIEVNFQYLISGIVLYLVFLLATSYRWLLLLKTQNIHLTFFDTFSLTMQGYFFSLVIPGGSIVGDLLKTAFLIKKIPKDQRVKGISSILMDRIIGMIALFSLSITSIIISLNLILKSNDNIKMLTIFIIVISLIGLCGGISVFFVNYFRKINFINNLIIKFSKSEDSFVSKILESVDIYKTKYKTILFTIILTFIFCHLNVGIILYLLTLGLGLTIPFYQVLLAVTIGNIIALIPITPTGIGTRDYTIIAILSIGLSIENITLVPLILTGIMVCYNLSGSLFFLLQKSKKLD